jgi:hypothetical protein
MAAARTMDTAFARGVHIGAQLAQQFVLLGPAYRARLERLSLADIGARQTFDTLNYYSAKRALYSRGQPAVARAYADSLIRAARSPLLAGPLAWHRTSLLAFAYAVLGDRAQAMRQLAQARAEMAAVAKGLTPTDSSDRYQDFASTFAQLGDADSSAVYVAQLLRLPGGVSKFSIRLDPTFDPVRSSPAFQRLLQ